LNPSCWQTSIPPVLLVSFMICSAYTWGIISALTIQCNLKAHKCIKFQIRCQIYYSIRKYVGWCIISHKAKGCSSTVGHNRLMCIAVGKTWLLRCIKLKSTIEIQI
jgi:hypothetical protein